VRVLIGHLDSGAFGTRLASWLDSPDHGALARRMAGALAMAAPLLEAAPSITEQLIRRVATLDDNDFLGRLPALREAFEVLSPAARTRFMEALRPTLSDDFDPRLGESPETLSRWAAADLRAREELLALLPRALEAVG
jgi:hypothetical protein